MSMSSENIQQLLAALSQLDQTQGQQGLGQQHTTAGGGQMQAAQAALNHPTTSVGGVAARTSPFQALGNGLQGAAGMMQQQQGFQQQQQALQQQAAARAQIQAQIAQMLRQGSQGDMAPGVQPSGATTYPMGDDQASAAP